MTTQGVPATTEQIRPYQGYPYVNPLVTDVPTYNPATANHWRPIERETRTTNNGNYHDSTTESQSTSRNEENNLGFLEETIFYDPFENRRIVIAKNEGPNSSQDPGGLQGSTSFLPPYMSKETSVYRPTVPEDDGLVLSPIPVNEFPEAPPSYAETIRPQVVERPRPPQTQVIVPEGLPTPVMSSQSIGNRKFVYCHHCGTRVHTLVVRQSGLITHIIALSFLLVCLFPITLAIYFTDCCKYRNHYCPNCNQLVDSEMPVLCQQTLCFK